MLGLEHGEGEEEVEVVGDSVLGGEVLQQGIGPVLQGLGCPAQGANHLVRQTSLKYLARQIFGLNILVLLMTNCCWAEVNIT